MNILDSGAIHSNYCPREALATRNVYCQMAGQKYSMPSRSGLSQLGSVASSLCVPSDQTGFIIFHPPRFEAQFIKGRWNTSIEIKKYSKEGASHPSKLLVLDGDPQLSLQKNNSDIDTFTCCPWDCCSRDMGRAIYQNIPKCAWELQARD